MATNTTAGTAVPHEAGHAKAFPPLDSNTFAPQLIWLALSFGLLYLLLKRFYLPRVGEVIEERRERRQRDLSQAEKIRAETDAALANYERALAEARGKAQTIVKGMRDTLVTEMEKERGTVEAEIAVKLADAERRIAQTKATALAGVKDIAGELAGAIVARLSGREVSKDEVQKALISRQAAE
ncbi:MAG TPA: F0F1 ATP synthase subunit B' [Hyphomicrobiaceae bacterium]|nr:F0F1 ATP synthase subunit B' [Hyphomicrobiaceae bacterium]